MTDGFSMRALTEAVDTGSVTLNAADAKAVRSALWDARRDVAREKARADTAAARALALQGENDKLVAQVVSEEQRAVIATQRAVRAERDFAQAAELIRKFVEDKAHAKHWRERGTVFLEAVET